MVHQGAGIRVAVCGLDRSQPTTPISATIGKESKPAPAAKRPPETAQSAGPTCSAGGGSQVLGKARASIESAAAWRNIRVSPSMARNIPAYRGWASARNQLRCRESMTHGHRAQSKCVHQTRNHRATPAGYGSITPMTAKTWRSAPLLLPGAPAKSLVHWPLFQRSQNSALFCRHGPGRPILAMRRPPPPQTGSVRMCAPGIKSAQPVRRKHHE